MRVAFTGFDGHTLNGATGLHFAMDADRDEGARRIRTENRARRNAAAVREGFSLEPRTFPFFVANQSNGAIDTDDFQADILEWFVPERGPRTLTGTRADGTAVELVVDVTWVKVSEESPDYIEGEFEATDRFWRRATDDVYAATPIGNLGTWTALPVLTFVPTSANVRHHTRSVTNALARPLRNHLYCLTPTLTNAGQSTTAHFEVFVNGISVPFTLFTPGTTPKIWVRLDLPASGSVNVDIWYGSGVTNSGTAGTLDPGSLNLSTSTNSNWVFDTARWLVSTHPEVPGSWVYGRLGIHPEGVIDGFVAEAAGSASVGIRSNTGLGGEGNAFILYLGIEAGATNALSGLALTLTNTLGTGAMYIYTRKYGQTVYARTLLFGSPSAWDIDDAVEVAFVLEANTPDGSGNYSANMQIAPHGSVTPSQVALLAGSVPTQAQVSDVVGRVLTGAFTNTTLGVSITCDRVYVDDGSIVVDCRPDGRSVTWPNGRAMWAGAGLSLSDPAQWFPLAKGNNAVTNTLAATWSAAVRRRYAA